MRPPSSHDRDRFPRRRASTATKILIALVAVVLVLATAGYAEARGAPTWWSGLSRLIRAAAGRSERAAAQIAAAPGDTVVLFGPKVFALGAATSATFVEKFTVATLPPNTTTPAASGYLLRATNGAGSASAITGGTIALNGAVVVTASQLAALSAGASLDIPVQLAPSDTIVAALTGPAGASMSVSVLAAPDPTFLVFGAKQYERATGAPVTITERFTVPAGGVAPSYLCVRNGELDGTRRNSAATVRLNGVDVVTQSELNQQVAGFSKRVTYLPAGQLNVLEVQLQGAPGSRLTMCATATDAAAPKITVTAPVAGLITRQTEVDAVGVVDDQTAVTVTVNGLAATVAAGTPGKTSFTARTPLATEGANTITIRAVDAAGNRTDSVRTVIRDTEAPVVTLDALPDSVLYRRDSVLTITGTITDRTKVTANVNGVALVVDSVTRAFSQQVTLAQGTNFIAITATDAAGNATSVVRQVTRDNVPPTLTLTAPAAGAITKVATTTVVGSAVGQSAVTVTVNGASAAVAANGAFSANVALTEGSNTLTVVATNAAGVTATATRMVTLDTQAPVIAWTAPVDGAFTKATSIDATGTVTDQSAVTLTLNGAAVALTTVNATTKSYLATEPLVADGIAVLNLVATDAAGNVTMATRGVTRDATAPVVTLQSPADGLSTSAATVEVSGSVADLSASSLTINGSATTIAPDGGFSTTVPLVTGANVITIVTTDAAGNVTTTTRMVTRAALVDVTLPPDPATVAPALNRTVATGVASSTSFLYSGMSPIQTGVATGVIQPYQASVIRGRVLTRDGAPMPGVAVTIHRHSELGKTISRADGAFDLAVNGGGAVTVAFTKQGHLSAQRRVDVPRQRWVGVEDVALVPLDTAVTSINLATTAPVARGSIVTDAAGTRRATLVFEQGTQASMSLPDGSVQPLTSLSVRATEYTVGAGGPRAMPASLPASSAYTYAAELSVDEAIAAGATSVEFTKPVSIFVENFIGFPVGIAVPVATYDRRRALWIPEANGRVIKVVGTNGGVAQLDVSGGGVASGDSLAALGITSAELGRIAELYPVGQTLWRFQLTHFTPVDANLSSVQRADMTPPYEPPKPESPTPPGGDDPQKPAKTPDQPDCTNGSIIGCEDRSLGETLPIAGANTRIVYASQHTPGYRADYAFDVSLGTSISDTLLASMRKILLRVSVAGKTTIDTFPAIRGQRVVVRWDGRDAYGRLVQGQSRMKIDVGYVYTNIPYGVPATSGTSFGQASGVPLPQTLREPLELWQTMMDRLVGSWSNVSTGLGGWTLAMHHAYDPASSVLYLGSGGKRSAGNLNPSIAGARGIRSPSGIIANPDGSLLILDAWTGRIYKLARDGTQTVFAGSGTFQSSGDGGLAVNAGMNPGLIARGPDGTVYVADYGANRIRKIDTAGVITPFAGSGNCSGSTTDGDGGPALLAQVCTFGSMAVGPDGSVYVISYKSGSSGGRVRRIGPDGIITHFAGKDAQECDYGGGGACQINVPAVTANLGFPRYLDVLPDGSVVIVDIKNTYVWKVNPGGLLTKLAGKGIINYSILTDGDGGPASLAGIGNVRSVATGPDGSVYLGVTMSTGGYVVRRIAPDGIITRVAGTATDCSTTRIPLCPATLNGAALQTPLPFLLSIGVSPDNTLLLGDGSLRAVLRVTKPLPGFDGNDLAIASEDGSELYRFDNAGRHLSTVDIVSGAVQYAFAYDGAGLVRTVTDANGSVTTVDRAADGSPRAIVSPRGQRTSLALSPSGYIEMVRAPGGETVRFSYDTLGLMLTRLDELGAEHQYSYSPAGLLASDRSPDGLIKTLASVPTSTGNRVTVTTGSLQPVTYLTESMSTGGFRQVITYPDGTSQTIVRSADDTTKTTLPDGTIQSMVLAADARFGLQAPTAIASVRLPSGLSHSVTSRRIVTMSNPNDPLSLTAQIDTVIENGIATTRSYDAASRTATLKSPEGRINRIILDSLGRPVVQTPSGLASSLFRYDATGRLDRNIDAGKINTFTYDALGRLATTVGVLGDVTRLTYDSTGRMLSRADAEGMTAMGYDAGGRLVSVTPPGRPAHRFDYTPGGLLASYQAPAVDASGPMIERYRYNANGQLNAFVRATADSMTLTYDAAGRLIAQTTDEDARTFAFSPQSGLLTSAGNSAGGQYSLVYDGALPVSTTLVAGPVTGTITYGWDNFFRPAAIGINGDVAPMTYDRDGLLLTTGALSIGRAATTGLATSTTLDGITSSTSYDSTGASVRTVMSANGAPLYDVQIGRDAMNRVLRQTETIAGQTIEFGFAYDSAGRIATVTRDGAAYAAYEYDQNGNRARRVAGAGVEQGTVDAQDRLSTYDGSSYRYTKAGALRYRITGTDTIEYHYDGFNALRWVRLPNGTRVDYLVDVLGRRIGRKVDGALVQGFIYQSDLQIAAELAPDGSVRSRFVYGTRENVPEYMVRGGARYRLITDRLGSVRLVVDATSGAVAQRIDYDEFGRIERNTSPGFQPFGYAGGLLDDATGLVKLGARDYDPVTGRFTTKDPLRFTAGDANLYRYVGNDPMNRVDPRGTVAGVFTGASAVFGGIIGGIDALSSPCRTFSKVMAGVGGGLVSGAITGAATELSVGLGLGIVGASVVGGVAGVVGNVVGSFLAGKPQSLLDNLEAGVAEALFGGLGGQIAKSLKTSSEFLRDSALEAAKELYRDQLQKHDGLPRSKPCCKN
ncbi:MAG: RHS repeat-associated core domain-containing protein [Gemmatimonadaceae bacterium]